MACMTSEGKNYWSDELRGPRFKRMTGERFGRHTDGSVELGDGRRTYYTLLMYLSGGSGQKTKTELSSDKDFSVEAAPPKEWLFFTPVEIVACYMRPVTLRRVSSISFFQT